MMPFTRWWFKPLSVACLVLLTLQCLARSGGGGGDFGSGGGGDGDGIMAIIYLLIYLPFPLNVIAVGVIVLVVYMSQKKYRESSSLNTIEQVNKGFIRDGKKNDLLQKIEQFNENEFNEKALFAFHEVQKAWMNKNLSPVRRFMSDGVYQRFNVQLLMMQRLKQNNLIEHLRLIEGKIAYVEQEHPYDIIHVQFKAEITEKYVSAYRELDQKYHESFIEFWTFIRKKNSQYKDIYHSNQCPSCGDTLPQDMGEVSKCNSCGSYINMGEFDWVLCEITQPEEFIHFVNNSSTKSTLTNRLAAFAKNVPGINSQLLEDKASNAYLQIRIAHALNDMNRIRRFSTETFYDSLAASKHKGFLFNRIYLRDVSLINVFENETHYFAAFYMQCKEQKVIIENDHAHKLDSALTAVPSYLALTLSKKNKLSAHSVFSHNCTQCGGIVTDTTDLVCPYCGTNLNSDERDWIVCGFFNNLEYEDFKSRFSYRPAIPKKKEEQLAEIDFRARDYAINNMMVVMMADGQLSDEERDYAIKMAKKLGFNSKKISALWEHTSANKMGIIMPDDKNDQQKVYKFMKKAAKVDGAVSEQEQLILDDVRAKYELQDN